VNKVDRSQILALKEMGYGEGTYAMDSMHKREMAVRTRDLRLVDKAKTEKMASIVGGKEVEFALDSASEWAVMMEPLNGLKIYYILQRYSPEFDDEVIVFYDKGVRDLAIPIDDLYDFTRLCANALVRASKTAVT
jgi:hypothetical protein